MVAKWILLFLLASLTHSDQLSGPVVSTTTGKVQGAVKTVLDKDISYFFGIPYAEPPVGTLRFMPPVPVRPWPDTINATSLAPSCAQKERLSLVKNEMLDKLIHQVSEYETWSEDMSENCLYLNVCVPNGDNKKPVLVYIHGGGFMTGTSAIIPDALVITGDVIVFSIAYRLGALGFLYFNSPEAPGNVGLLDQRLALKWIRENAERFGGDSERITMFGGSAGSASVSYHLLSPLSRDLFQRAIMESGAAIMPWAFSPRELALKRSVHLAKLTDCHFPDAELIIKCMQNVSFEEICDKQWQQEQEKGIFDNPFVPTIDGFFLKEPPMISLQRGHFKERTEILLGSCKDEGATYAANGFPQLFPMTEYLNISKRDYDQAVAQIFPRHWAAVVANVTGYAYNDWPYLNDTNIKGIIDMIGDWNFLCQQDIQAFHFAEHEIPVFMYLFVHRTEFLTSPKWMGVTHTAERVYVLGTPLLSDHYTAAEKILSKKIMQYWSNFAKFGNPNQNVEELQEGHTNLERWPHWTMERRHYQTLDVNISGSHQGPSARNCEYWRTLVPLLRHQCSEELSFCAADEYIKREEDPDGKSADVLSSSDSH